MRRVKKGHGAGELQVSMDAVQAGLSPDARAAMLLVSLLLFRVFYLWVAPLELSPDEAYYWEWSRRLDWGYYSKPPMVAWIMAASTFLLGNSEFAVRLPAAILATGALFCCWRMAHSMFGSRAGLLALLLAACSPGASVAAFVMTIDAPLLFFWGAASMSLWEAMRRECIPGADDGRAFCWWLAAGLAAGAGLLAKQTMAAFWPAAIIALALHPRTRHLLYSFRLWLSAAVSILLLSPAIWWNMHHDWITMQHTAHHFHQSGRTFLDSLRTFAEFAGSQLGVLSPLTCLLVYATGGVGLVMLCRFLPEAFGGRASEIRRLSGGGWPCRLLLLCLTGIAMLVPVTLLSLKQRVNANWPAPFYMSGFVLVAGWYYGKSGMAGMLEGMRGMVRPAVATGAALACLVYSLPWLVPLAGLEGSAVDPLVRVRGWRELAAKVENIRHKLPAPEKTFLVTRRRQTASELAFYLPGNPRIYRWSGNRKRITTQYELWPVPDTMSGWDVLFIIDVDKEVPGDLPGRFDDFYLLGNVDIPLGGGRARRFAAYHGVNFHAAAAGSAAAMHELQKTDGSYGFVRPVEG